MTTKVPPAYDGRSSWFAYEDAIDDWVDITEFGPEKQGPALRNRLEGKAAIHKRLLDRDRLKDKVNGVRYFKSYLRPLFVKGASNVFLYRFQQFMTLHRGNGDMLRWITRFQLSREDAVLRTNERLKRQHSLTIPITANLIALMFVSLADLTQDQRQVLTSLMAHRNRPLADYRIEELREVYLEVFCTTRTSVENPLLAPSGNAGRKSFLIIEEGYLDQHEGFWVEDEDDGAEGFLELDEDALWVYDDDSAAWFQRRFQGRRMKRGQKGRRKGKGKGGKARGGRRFFRRKKGNSNVAEEQQDAWQAWDWQDGGYDEDEWSWEPHSEESYAMKGKGKKGKKGKNKGKWSSKDGKGDGGKDHFANTASETPQPSSSTTHQTFFAMNADYDLLREFESKEDLHVPHDPCVQSFMSVPEDEFSYLTHALTPTSMVLDWLHKSYDLKKSSPGTHGVFFVMHILIVDFGIG